MSVTTGILSKTVALVTGGSSGLGAATAKYLIDHGAKVLVADLQEQYETFERNFPNETTEQCQKSSKAPKIVFCSTDVTNASHVTDALDLIESTFRQPLNAVVNCAGIATAARTLSKKGHPHPLDTFEKVLKVNTIGTFNVSRLAAERMYKASKSADNTADAGTDTTLALKGCIINTASIAGYEGQIGQVAYATSKGAIIGMTLPMARELASFGIRVVTIAPGLFATPLLDGLPQSVRDELGASVPCPNRLGNPQEFGQLVGSILSNPYINGSVIRLDGALRMPP